MYEIFLLLVIAILPIILLGVYVYEKDRNKEPLKLIIKLFVGGIISVFMTLFLTEILHLAFPFFAIPETDLSLLELIPSVFIGIALVEEFCKWLILYTFSYHSKEFDEFYDMLVYAVFVSLGFACFENILYVLDSGITTGIVRAVSAVPGHASDAVFMGFYLGLAKLSTTNNNKKLERKNIILSLAVPTILHGIYDYCLFSQSITLILIDFVFMIALYVFACEKIKQVSSINRKFRYEFKYCPNCGTKVEFDYCQECGRKNY